MLLYISEEKNKRTSISISTATDPLLNSNHQKRRLILHQGHSEPVIGLYAGRLSISILLS